jgi:hypothetical protein
MLILEELNVDPWRMVKLSGCQLVGMIQVKRWRWIVDLQQIVDEIQDGEEVRFRAGRGSLHIQNQD